MDDADGEIITAPYRNVIRLVVFKTSANCSTFPIRNDFKFEPTAGSSWNTCQK